MSHPDWNDVAIFLAVAERGAIARAARDLGVSAATVTRRLEALETGIGHRLFDRLPNGLALTEAGRRLVAAARTMREGADALARMAQSLDQRPPQKVTVTATQSMSLLLVQRIDILQQSCPGTTIEIAATRAQLSLARREADIALRMRRPPNAGDLVVRRLGHVAQALYGAERLLRERSTAGGTFDLKGLPVIGTTREPGLSLHESWLSRHFDKEQVVIRISETALRRDAIRAGHGVGILPCFAGDADPLLVRLGGLPEELGEDAFLLKHADLKDVPAIRQVADAIAKLFRSESELLSGRSKGAAAEASDQAVR